MLYKVEIVETLNKIVDVEAETKTEAIEKIETEYFNQEIVLDSDCMTAPVEFNILGD